MRPLETIKGKKTADWKVAKKLFLYFWPKDNKKFRLSVVFAFSCMVISRVFMVWMPIFYKQSIDYLGMSENIGVVTSVPFGLLLAYGFSRIFSSFFAQVRDIIFSGLEQKAVHALALNVFKHLHTLSLKFHLERKTGKLTRVIERGVVSVDRALRFLTFNILPTILEILFVFIVLLFMYELAFSFIMLVTIGLYIFFTLEMTKWRSNFLRQMNTADDDSNTKNVDSLLNYETVKYFSNEDHEYKRFGESFEKYGKASVRMKQSLAQLNIGQAAIVAIGSVAIMLLAAYRITQNTMTLGDFVLVNAYLVQLYIPLGNLGFSYREIKQALINLEDVFEVLDEKIDVPDKPNAKDLQKGEGRVEFSDVHFSYYPEREILKGVTFTLDAGKVTAIVGPSGSGKSTIAKLLCRFYDVTKGKILVDNQNIASVRQSSLRKHLGVVPQDTVLFNDTLGYNIEYARPGAKIKDITYAAHMAELEPLLKKLPNKYKTLVGERGLKLSGGEKQRLAIARVILKDPQIFVFDEATSSLDTKTEKDIQQNIEKVSKGKTTLIIAHRLSTIVNADKIIVLSNGRIEEQGTHTSLLLKKGMYAKMWKYQQKEEKLQQEEIVR